MRMGIMGDASRIGKMADQRRLAKERLLKERCEGGDLRGGKGVIAVIGGGQMRINPDDLEAGGGFEML